jgi:hypothetical protein
MGIFDKLVMTEEEKDQARQLNQISHTNMLQTHNWELQQKVQMLDAEIIYLRAENEKLLAGADLLDTDERDAIALQALKSSYENIAYSHRDSIDEEDRRYHQDMLDTLDGAIGIFSNLEELEDWNSKKAALVK